MMRLVLFEILLCFGGCNLVPPSPLASAARQGNLAAIRRLARAGANLNEPSGVNGWTPLHHAIHKNQAAAVKLLLDLGADVNAQVPHSVTPLMMAAGYGYHPIVQILLEHHADAAVRDVHGETALDYARHGVADIDRFTWPRAQTACVRLLQAPAQ
jgi:ankyrin repeat protein